MAKEELDKWYLDNGGWSEETLDRLSRVDALKVIIELKRHLNDVYGELCAKADYVQEKLTELECKQTELENKED